MGADESSSSTPPELDTHQVKARSGEPPRASKQEKGVVDLGIVWLQRRSVEHIAISGKRLGGLKLIVVRRAEIGEGFLQREGSQAAHERPAPELTVSAPRGRADLCIDAQRLVGARKYVGRFAHGKTVATSVPVTCTCSRGTFVIRSHFARA